MSDKVAALFVDAKGIYPKLLGADACWDEKRDARLYLGPDPVVAHPPCGRWCSMARLNESRWGAKVGEDGGCFAAAVKSLSKFGGVLEHPAQSLAWPAFKIPKPNQRGWKRVSARAWVCQVWQSAYGHICNKKTWLVYIGNRPPFNLDWRQVPGTHQVGGGVYTGNNNKPRATKDQAIHTPLAFAEELIKLARWSRG